VIGGIDVQRVRISQPGVSKHRKVLRQAGLVEVRAEGRTRWYGLRAEPLAQIGDWLEPPPTGSCASIASTASSRVRRYPSARRSQAGPPLMSATARRSASIPGSGGGRSGNTRRGITSARGCRVIRRTPASSPRMERARPVDDLRVDLFT